MSRRYEKLYNNLVIEDLDGIYKRTGCLKPCHYTEYSLVGEILAGRDNFTSVYVQRARSTSTVKREILGTKVPPLTISDTDFMFYYSD